MLLDNFSFCPVPIFLLYDSLHCCTFSLYSNLCESLLRQQETLTNEVQHQADVIGNLSGKKNHANNPNRKHGAKAVAAVGAERSQSGHARAAANRVSFPPPTPPGIPHPI